MKNKLKLIGVLLFVYVILFEFILPINKILPKPSLLAESFVDVWFDYSLFESLGITTTIIYLSLFTAFIFIHFTAPLILRLKLEITSSLESLKIFHYFPAFFFAILFVYWFNNSLLAEFLFGFLSSFILLAIETQKLTERINFNYVLVAKNLGLSKYHIYSKVVYKNIQPYLFERLLKIHYYLWILIMIYEFIGKINGFGGAYNYVLLYNDFTGLFSIAVIISLLILIGDQTLKFINNKIFFWE